jgi:hypothetical protein
MARPPRIPRNILFAMIVMGACITGYLIVTFLFLWHSYAASQH